MHRNNRRRVSRLDPTPATMRDVAQRAGVSLATVSYVVNKGPKPVSDELRECVLSAMRELDYKSARRGRAARHPLLVGVVVPDMSNTFFSRVIDAAGALLRIRGPPDDRELEQWRPRP
jgi:DNA-binding LacI/PurR family transcriptional regulator